MSQTLFTHPNILIDGVGAPKVDAFVVENGVISALGDRVDLCKAFPAAKEVGLPGAAIVAGFHDAHVHTGTIARDLASPNLRGSRDLGEAQARLRMHLANDRSAGWVTGGYWDANDWATGMPTRHDLDSVCADRPIALASLDAHSVWVNTLGLKLAGVDASTPDPVGGIILRESDGRTPTGVMRESAASGVVELSERGYDAELPALLLRAQTQLLSMGLTHVTDFDDDVTRLGYERLHRDGDLKLRVHKGIPMVDLDRAIAEGWRTGAGDAWITTGPVKLFSDGALGSHSAHMGCDFADAPGSRGVEVMTVAEMSEFVQRANSAGIAVATHAIGDAANRGALDAYALHVELTRAAGLRNRIEHAQHIARADLKRFVELGVIPSQQPTHCTTDFKLAGKRIGERDLANYAWRSLLDLGAHVAFGSDAPIEPAHPLFGIHAAVTRQNRENDPVGGFEPHERVTVAEALRSYSAGAAYAAGLESRVGRIAVGQYADVVALGADPHAIDPAEISNIHVAATIVGGEIVYEGVNA